MLGSCLNFISTVRSAGPEPALVLSRMQMAPLTALMIEDNVLLLVRDVFTFRALSPTLKRLESEDGGKKHVWPCIMWSHHLCISAVDGPRLWVMEFVVATTPEVLQKCGCKTNGAHQYLLSAL